MIRPLVSSAVLGAALIAAPFGGTASAMPAAPLDPTAGQLIQTFGGCGPFAHRGPWGGCRPGGQWGGYIPGVSCPPGWHIGPYGRRCWPNW